MDLPASADRAGSPRAARPALAAAAISCVFLAIAALALTDLALMPLLFGIAASTTVAGVPFLISAARGRLDPFEPPVLFSVFYLIGFPVTALMAAAFGEPFDPSGSLPWFPAALLLAALGMGAWFLGYYAGPGAALASAVPRLSRRWDERRALLAVACFGAAGWFAQLVVVVRGGYLHGFRTEVTGQWSTAVAWVASFVFVALAIAAVRQYQLMRAGKRAYWWTGILVVGVIMELLYATASGWRTQALEALLIPLLVAAYMLKHIRWSRIIGAALVSVFLIFPFANAYRAELASETDLAARRLSTAPVADLRLAALRGGEDLAHLQGWDFAAASVQTTIQRLGMVQIVAAIIRGTPAVWPFEPAETLQALIVSLAPPRFLIKKPTVAVGGNEFAHRYHLIRPEDADTSVGLTRLGELYLNGWLGAVILGMWIEGAFARVVYDYLIGRRPVSPAALVLYTMFILSFLLFTAFADYALMLKVAVVLVPTLLWISAPRRGARAARTQDTASPMAT